MAIRENIELIKSRIDEVCKRVERNLDDIKIVAATKTRTVDEIKQAINCGINIIGENRVQDAESKFDKLLNIEKHMIGHLQTNKVKKAVKIFDCIQSVDSIKLANEINKRAAEINKKMPIFIEINIGAEESKFGIRKGDVESFYEDLQRFENIKVEGIMSILPYVEPENTRIYFKQLYEIFSNLKLKYLSAGMSNDYVVAVEEGSNMLRLGTAIFGPRR